MNYILLNNENTMLEPAPWRNRNHKHYEIFNDCLPAHPVGYGTNGVPNPPYIDDGTANDYT